MDSAALIEGVRARGREGVHPAARETVAQRIAEEAKPGDVVIFLGAGDITAWARALPEELLAVKGETVAS